MAHRGLTVWDVTFEKEGPRYLLTVVVDKESGVDIEDCEYVSRAIDPLLDAPEFNSLPPYTLCVSSAGMERALRRPEHFQWLWAAGWSFLSISPMTARKPKWAFWKTMTAIP